MYIFVCALPQTAASVSMRNRLILHIKLNLQQCRECSRYNQPSSTNHHRCCGPYRTEMSHRGEAGLLQISMKPTYLLLAALTTGAYPARAQDILIHAENAFSALCFGTVVGYIYTETRSLLPCLVVHATSNAMFSVGPRVNLAFWTWLGVAQPFWVRGPWYLAAPA